MSKKVSIFEPEKGKKNGIGLEGMRERAEIIGGDLSIESKRGEGTKVTLKVLLFDGKTHGSGYSR